MPFLCWLIFTSAHSTSNGLDMLNFIKAQMPLSSDVLPNTINWDLQISVVTDVSLRSKISPSHCSSRTMDHTRTKHLKTLTQSIANHYSTTFSMSAKRSYLFNANFFLSALKNYLVNVNFHRTLISCASQYQKCTYSLWKMH